MSSTAIVVVLMAERAELESEHGRRVMGILLFQDLAWCRLLIADSGAGLCVGAAAARHWAGRCIKAVVLVGLLLTWRAALMRWWLTLVARRKSERAVHAEPAADHPGLAWLA